MLRKIYSHGGETVDPAFSLCFTLDRPINPIAQLAGKIINCDSKFQRYEPAVMRKQEKTQFDDLTIDGSCRGRMVAAWRGRRSHGG